MKKRLLILTAGFLPIVSLAATLTVPGDYGTIQEAITASVAGDEVVVADGTYAINSTINVNKAITLSGTSEAGTILDISCGSGYGIHPSVGGVTLENMTLNVVTPSGTYAGYVIHASGTPNVMDGLNINNLTVQGASGADKRRAGVDIHGYDNVALSNVSSNDATWGNGFQITGCDGVTVENCSTSNNAWGSLALYCSTPLDPDRATSNVTINGDNCSFGEGNVFIEDQFGLVCTNITVTGYEYLMWNDEFRDGAEGFTFIKDTLADAVAHALLGFVGYEDATSIQEIATGDFVVDPSLGIGLTIQAAIDAADPGDTINVAAGTFEEQLHITKDNLTLQGAGVASTTVLSPVDLELYYTTSNDNYPIVYIDGCEGVTVTDLTVDGDGRGNNNYRFQGVGFWNASGALTDVDVLNVMDTPFSGAQHGVGVYAYDDGVAGPYTINLTDVNVVDYQKGGIALNGAGSTANVVGCTTVGQGATDITAQNGIQFYGTATGTISGCTVSGNIYTGEDWAASGVLLISAGDVEIVNSQVSDGDPAVYCQDTNADASGLTINNSDANSGNGFYVRVQSGMPALAREELPAEADPSPFGDSRVNRELTRGTSTVNLDACSFVGQTTGYGVAASNYVPADLIDITLTQSYVQNWGWGMVVWASGGEVVIDANNNSLDQNDGFAYVFSGLAATQDLQNNWWGTTDVEVLAASILGDIDYNYWLANGTDTSADPGFQGDFSQIWLGPGGSLIDAIAMVSGSTIYVAPGTYVEAGQVVIDKDITIIGDATDRPVFMTDRDTAASGDARGWFLVQADYTLDMSNLVFDGSGYLIYQGFRHLGNGSFTNCDFLNIKYNESGPNYGGVAAAVFGGTGNPVNFTGCTFAEIGRVGVLYFGAGCSGSVFDGCTYTGKGPGDWLDYCLDISAGAVITVQNSTITACQGEASSDGSTSGAVMATDLYGPGTSAEVYNCVLTGNTTGILVGYDVTDASTVVAHNNVIADNDEFGVSSTGVVVDALGNWWGDATGAYHPTLNSGGLGNEVSDNVLFDPWSYGNVFFTPDPQTISLADLDGGFYKDDVVCEYLGGGSGTVYGYSIDVTWDDTVIDAVPADFLRPDNGSFATASLFLVTAITNGVRVDAALGGTTPGITMGELFKATFTADGTPDYATSDLTFNLRIFRDGANQPLTGFVGDDGLYIVDLIDPAVGTVAIVNNTLSHTDDYVKDTDGVTITAVITDGGGVDLTDIYADLTGFGGGAAVNPDTYAAGLATWTLAGVTCTPADGTVTVTVTADDGAGNSSFASDDITSDNTAPAAVTGFVCAPGHNLIDCAWTNASGNDVNYYQTEIMEAAWGDYPTYTGSAPGYPVVGTAKWIGTGDMTTLNYDAAGLERDIIYLQAYAVDMVLHYSSADAGAQSEATNYYLGDGVGNDGIIFSGDLGAFSTCYGTVLGAGTFNDEFDIGPTDDWSSFGLPLPDESIDFEDMIIFAMNYGTYGPTINNPLNNVTDGPTAGTPMLFLEGVDETWTLTLSGGDLKGFSAQIQTSNELVSANAGENTVMYYRDGDTWFVDVVSFSGLVIDGSTVELQFAGQSGVTLVSVDGRDTFNNEIMVTAENSASIPAVFVLEQNYPNPFNPVTTIKYGLADAAQVELLVYNTLGQVVSTLVSVSQEAGFYTVEFDASHLASGVYYYRVTAGEFTDMKKLMLIK